MKRNDENTNWIIIESDWKKKKFSFYISRTFKPWKYFHHTEANWILRSNNSIFFSFVNGGGCEKCHKYQHLLVIMAIENHFCWIENTSSIISLWLCNDDDEMEKKIFVESRNTKNIIIINGKRKNLIKILFQTKKKYQNHAIEIQSIWSIYGVWW